MGGKYWTNFQACIFGQSSLRTVSRFFNLKETTNDSSLQPYSATVKQSVTKLLLWTYLYTFLRLPRQVK